jgi:hypothetical protein
MGGNTDVQLADSFYASQSSKTFQQLGEILFRITVFQPEKDVMNHPSSILLHFIPPDDLRPIVCPPQSPIPGTRKLNSKSATKITWERMKSV